MNRQRQRHGVNKKLAEGIGGLLAGAALVLFLRSLAKTRARSAALTPEPAGPNGDSARASA